MDSSRIVIQVPIKSTESERLPGKNFIPLRGKPLCYHLLGELEKVRRELPLVDIFIDSDCNSIFKNTKQFNFKNHLRVEWLAGRDANGNHLLSNFAIHRPHYDIYVQAFVTAVNLKAETITRIIKDFSEHQQGSATIGTYQPGFYWDSQVRPLNYDPFSPTGLHRSQDQQIFKESTGLYLIRKSLLNVTGCRLAVDPHLYSISAREAVDVDTTEDLALAEVYY